MFSSPPTLKLLGPVCSSFLLTFFFTFGGEAPSFPPPFSFSFSFHSSYSFLHFPISFSFYCFFSFSELFHFPYTSSLLKTSRIQRFSLTPLSIQLSSSDMLSITLSSHLLKQSHIKVFSSLLSLFSSLLYLHHFFISLLSLHSLSFSLTASMTGFSSLSPAIPSSLFSTWKHKITFIKSPLLAGSQKN